MTTNELLTTLRERGITLEADGGKLRCRGAREALTPALIGEVRRQKAELIELIEAETRADAAAAVAPPSTPQSGIAAPTPAIPQASRNDTSLTGVPQEPMLFLHEMDPDNVSDHSWAAWSFDGPLDRTAVTRALDDLVRRHEALRLAVATRDGASERVVVDPMPAPIEFRSLAGTPAGQRDSEQRRLAGEFFRRPFDLATAPLFRTMLIECERDRHVMVWVCHRVAVDGGSLAVMQGEFAALYQAHATGGAAATPELAVQAPDFAEWQRSQLTASRHAELAAYWKARIPQDLAPLEMPADRPRPPVQAFDGAMRPVEIPAARADGFRALAREEGCTLLVALMACLKVLCHRISGQGDIVIGTPVAIRHEPGLTGMDGTLLNTLPVRTTLTGDLTFRELLAHEQANFQAAYEHRELPLDKIVEAVDPPRDPSRNPLFQVMLELRNKSDLELDGLDADPAPPVKAAAQVDLAFHILDDGAALSGDVFFDSNLFEPATIDRLVGQLGVVIDAVAANPDLAVSEIPLLGEDERETLLVEWNATATPFEAEKGMHHLIAAEAARRPDATALVCGDDTLTYRELDERSNRLARHLQDLGVGPDTLVGLSVTRSLGLVVGALAILKAGGAYVPMDPTYPKERRGFMVEDTATPLIVTESALVDDLPPHDAALVRLDADWPRIAGHSAEPLSGDDFSAGQLAYVIFTSGSTGRPKGVMVEHRNASNFFTAMDGVIRPDRDGDPGTWLAVTSLSFDISVLELFWTLSRGFKVVVYAEDRDGGDGSPGSVPALIARHGVTHMQCVPAMARMLLTSEAGTAALSGLAKLLIGGEAFPGPLAADLNRHVRGDVINMYGPTETTVWSTSYPAAAGGDTVPIGRPVANTEVYVLDAYGAPAPVGVAGELFIGGAGVTRGYLGRPDLTAERFIANRFAATGGRLYRTGDRVAWRADGVLEYLGRLDFQVKIRGFRIELGEIEAAIVDAAPAPVHAVVSTWTPTTDDVRLVAYIETARPDAIDPAALRESLKHRLPDYMVPQHVVLLDTFPKTANGKIDRNQLPPPVQIAKSEAIEPAGALEREIAVIWRQRLHAPEIGRTESFFDLGGHSLSAVQVAGDIARAFGVAFAPRHLMEGPTVADVARNIEALRAAGTTAPLPPPSAASAEPAATSEGSARRSMKRHESFWKGLKNRLLQVLALYAPGMSTLRVRLHRARGVTIGEHITIGTDVLIDTSSPHLVWIGNNVQIGIRTTFIAHFGDMTPTGPDAKPTIRVEDDVYIGPGTIILPNVTIGRGSVVTAGSVVNQSVPPGTVVQGNPAVPVAHCGEPLAWNSYESFMRNLSPVEPVPPAATRVGDRIT